MGSTGRAALPVPMLWWWWWWSEFVDRSNHFSASSHLGGTDLLGSTSWWWCEGLAKNSIDRPGIAGTTCCGELRATPLR